MSIEAMVDALEALEEVQLAIMTTPWLNRKVDNLKEAIKHAKRHEPIAWVYSYKGAKSLSMNHVAGVRAGPLYASPLHAWGTVSDAQLIEEVKNRGFIIKGAKIVGKWNGLGSDDFNDFNPYFKAEEAARWAERKLKEKNMTENKPEARPYLDHLFTAVMADTDALEDAKMTLEVIKKTDPGVYDEMINDTLALIRKALSSSILGVIDKLAHREWTDEEFFAEAVKRGHYTVEENNNG